MFMSYMTTADIAARLDVTPGRVRQLIAGAAIEAPISVPGSLAARRTLPPPVVGSYWSRVRGWDPLHIERWIAYVPSPELVARAESWGCATLRDNFSLACYLSDVLGTPCTTEYAAYVRECVEREERMPAPVSAPNVKLDNSVS